MNVGKLAVIKYNFGAVGIDAAEDIGGDFLVLLQK